MNILCIFVSVQSRKGLDPTSGRFDQIRSASCINEVVSMNKGRKKLIGYSYAFRVAKIINIYEEHSKEGLSNREILRRYIHPIFPICERTFYNMINNSMREEILSIQSQISNDKGFKY